MNHNNYSAIHYPDPNDTVEEWKDRLYAEIKNLPKEEIGEYLDRKAEAALQRMGVVQKSKTLIQR